MDIVLNVVIGKNVASLLIVLIHKSTQKEFTVTFIIDLTNYFGKGNVVGDENSSSKLDNEKILCNDFSCTILFKRNC